MKIAAIFLMLQIVNTAGYQHAPLFGRAAGSPIVRIPTSLRARTLTSAEPGRGEAAGADDSEATGGAGAGESLESQFARIARARASGIESAPPSPDRPADHPAGQPEKFDGIREIILVDGKPVSVPRRAAPEVSLRAQYLVRVTYSAAILTERELLQLLQEKHMSCCTAV